MIDSFSLLSKNIISLIASRLDVKSRVNFSQTNKRNHAVVVDNAFWQREINQYLPYLKTRDLNRYQTKAKYQFFKEFKIRKSEYIDSMPSNDNVAASLFKFIFGNAISSNVGISDDDYYQILAAGMGKLNSIEHIKHINKRYLAEEVITCSVINGCLPVFTKVVKALGNDLTVSFKKQLIIKVAEKGGHPDIFKEVMALWGNDIPTSFRSRVFLRSVEKKQFEIFEQIVALWDKDIHFATKNSAFIRASKLGCLPILKRLGQLYGEQLSEQAMINARCIASPYVTSYLDSVIKPRCESTPFSDDYHVEGTLTRGVYFCSLNNPFENDNEFEDEACLQYDMLQQKNDYKKN